MTAQSLYKTSPGRISGAYTKTNRLDGYLESALQQDSDPPRYVCREVRHQYDIPQNQLLKYMVEHLGDCLEMVPNVLRTGGCYPSVSEKAITMSKSM